MGIKLTSRKTKTLAGVKFLRYIPMDGHQDIPTDQRGCILFEDRVTKQTAVLTGACVRKLLRLALQGKFCAHFNTLYENPVNHVDIYVAVTDVHKTEFLVATMGTRFERKLAISKAKTMRRRMVGGEAYAEVLIKHYGPSIIEIINRVSMEDAPPVEVAPIQRRPTAASSHLPENYVRRTGRRF